MGAGTTHVVYTHCLDDLGHRSGRAVSAPVDTIGSPVSPGDGERPQCVCAGNLG
jgi:hypothetical protein